MPRRAIWRGENAEGMDCIVAHSAAVGQRFRRSLRNDGPVKVSQRSVVPPFAVMEILGDVERRRARGETVRSLCAGEPDGGAPTDVRERAAALLQAGEPLGYTAALGMPELRATIAAHYERSYGVDVDPEAVAITTGSSGAFVLAFLARSTPVIASPSRGPATRPTATSSPRSAPRWWRSPAGRRCATSPRRRCWMPRSPSTARSRRSSSPRRPTPPAR